MAIGMRARFILSLGSIILLVLPSASGLLLKDHSPVPGARPQESQEAVVRLVLVDLVVVDKDGRFATGLSRDDFEIFEDGKKVDLQSADLIRMKRPEPGTLPAEDQAVLQATTRDSRFFVIFDSINTIQRMLSRSKPEIIEKLLSIVELGQQVMVLELAEEGGMKILQPLTRDQMLVARAVEKASGSIWVEKAADALSIPAIVGRPDPGRAGEPHIGKGMEQSGQAAFEAENRRRFEKTINGLLAVMNLVKGFPGRKSVLLISGGIPSLSFVRFFEGRGGAIEDATAVQSEIAAAKVIDPFKVLQKSGFRSGQEIFEDLVRFANSHNICFYALDPDNYLRYVFGDMAYENFPRVGTSLGALKRGGRQRPDEIEEIKKAELSKLQSLAGDTGGVALVGGSKFDEFQRVIDRDFTMYYELSFTPKRKKADGKYHKIEVKVRRPGVDIRFRQGYLDYTDEQKESLLFASASYNPSLFKEIPFAAQVVPFIKGKDKYLLWIQTALPVKRVVGGEENWDKQVSLKLKITVDDPHQDAGYLSDVTIPLVLGPALLQRIRQAEYFAFSCCSKESELKAERYRVTVALYNQSLDEMGTTELFLNVPRPEKTPEASIMNAVMGNLVKTEKIMGIPFTITGDDGTLDVPGHKFYPMAVPHVSRGRKAALFFQVYAPQKPEGLGATTALARDGQELSAVPMEVVFEEWNKKAGIWNIIYNLSASIRKYDHVSSCCELK